MKRDFELRMNEMKLKSDAEIMEIAASNMKERLALAENAMDLDRTLRHDRRHFEALLLTLAQEGKYDEVKRYLEERISKEPKAEKIFCDNTTVNAAIAHYVSVATSKNIKITVSANIPSNLEVDEMGLAITISNLLENAIHATEKLPEEKRFIEITAKYKKQLILEIVNSCEKKATLDEDGYPLTTEEGHGTGTRSVLAFVNQTESDILYIAGNDIFKVRMIIG
jgi:sensor histidine kinase regulating citrate/malate metabolism